MLEARIQADIVLMIRREFGKKVLFFSVPNEAASGPVRQGRLIAMGLHAGVSDLVLVADGKVAFMEVKNETGRQSAVQKSFADIVTLFGHPYVLVRSVEDARRFISSWLEGKEA